MEPTDWFTQARDSFLFSKRIDQKRISEYYMELDKAKEFYLKGAKGGYLFMDFRDGFGAYYDPELIFNNNVASRVGHSKYEATYKLYYGGKVLLEQQVNYLFSDNASSEPTFQHLIGALPVGAIEESRVNYRYDNNSLLSPTRVIQSRSNGDQLIIRERRSSDFTNNFDPVIKHMLDSNVLTPVIKKQTILKKANSDNYYLLSEQAIKYIDTINSIGQVCFLPQKEYKYLAGLASINPLSLEHKDNKFYSVDESHYRETYRVEYSEQGGKFYPVKVESQDKSMIKLYDTRTGVAYLNSQHNNPLQFGGMIFNPWEDVSLEMINGMQIQQQNYEILKRFKSNFEQYKALNTFDNFRKYRDSEDMQILLQFIDCILEKSSFKKISTIKQSIIAENIVAEFVDTVGFYGMYSYLFPIPYGVSDYEAFPEVIKYFTDMDEQQYDFMFQIQDGGLDTSVTMEQVVIGPGEIQGKYKLITLLKPNMENFSMSYTVCQEGNISNCTLPDVTVVPGKWQLLISKIDITKTQGSVLIKVNVPLRGSGIKMVVLVPENAVFEALSFNTDGTVFCKFNQNGQMELNEYDTGGKLIRVKDRDGNILNEYDYNTVFNN